MISVSARSRNKSFIHSFTLRFWFSVPGDYGDVLYRGLLILFLSSHSSLVAKKFSINWRWRFLFYHLSKLGYKECLLLKWAEFCVVGICAAKNSKLFPPRKKSFSYSLSSLGIRSSSSERQRSILYKEIYITVRVCGLNFNILTDKVALNRVENRRRLFKS